MTEQDDDQLRARLRAADPAASLPPVTSTEVSRLVEETMTHDETRPAGRRPLTRPLTWLSAAAAAAAVVVVGAGGLALVADDEPSQRPPAAQGPAEDRTSTELTVPTAAAGRCQVPNAQVLATKPVAVDATVESIDDGTVTLVPNQWYAGQATDLLTVQAPSPGMDRLLTSVSFEEGERYLVAADEEGSVMLCGFSAPWSTGLEALYAEAFPG